MTLCTAYDGCSAEKEETLLQNDLYETYLNSISFFCNTSYEIRVHYFCSANKHFLSCPLIPCTLVR